MGAFLSYAVHWTTSLPTLFHRNRVTISKYMYEELPAGRYIRLLTLEPGNQEDDLVCSLAVSSIADAPPYEALSYVWGDPDDRLPIKCSEGRLNITTNLHSALRHLRLQNKGRVLWADAICIDQQDIDEREKQVLLMRHVYSGAQQVLIWLGRESPDDCDAFDFIHWSQDKLPDLEPGQDLIPNREEFAQLFTRPWFERIWVIQEVASAAHAVCVYGHQQITWDLLVKAVSRFSRYGLISKIDDTLRPTVLQSLQNVLLIKICRDLLNDQSLELIDVLCQSRNFKSTDSRDKIHALMGLLPEADVLLAPDYRMPCDEFFKRASVQDLVHNKRLNFLSCTSYDVPAPDHLPSWVSDWSLPVTQIPFVVTRSDFNAGGTSRAEIGLFPDGVTLFVTGKCLGQITRISKLKGPEFRGPATGGLEMQEFGSVMIADLQHRLDWLDECYSISREGTCDQSIDNYDMPLQQDFLQSLVCEFEGFSGQHTSVEFASQFEFYRRDLHREKKMLERLWAENEIDSFSEVDEQEERDFMASSKFTELDTAFMTQLSFGGYKRKYCRTNEGSLGWVPLRAQVGDLICLLHGGNVLYVLRSLSRALCELIGEAYVKGFMHGEALNMEQYDPQDFHIK